MNIFIEETALSSAFCKLSVLGYWPQTLHFHVALVLFTLGYRCHVYSSAFSPSPLWSCTPSRITFSSWSFLLLAIWAFMQSGLPSHLCCYTFLFLCFIPDSTNFLYHDNTIISQPFILAKFFSHPQVLPPFPDLMHTFFHSPFSKQYFSLYILCSPSWLMSSPHICSCHFLPYLYRQLTIYPWLWLHCSFPLQVSLKEAEHRVHSPRVQVIQYTNNPCWNPLKLHKFPMPFSALNHFLECDMAESIHPL